MFRKIIVGYDESEQARDALALGQELKAATGAELVLAGVVDWEPVAMAAGLGVPAATLPPEIDELTEGALQRLAGPAEEAGATPRAQVSSSPARGLGEIAQEEDGDLIVIGSCHRGRAGRILAGSVGERLLQGSPCAVAVAPVGYARQERHGLRTVGVGFDGDEEAARALGVAAMVAKDAGAVLKVVAVAPGAVFSKALEDKVDWALGALHGEVTAEGSVLHGDPADKLASLGVDLLVLGSRRYGPLRSVLLGGVSLPLVRGAEHPILVVPRGVRVPSEAAEAEPAVN